MAKAELAGVSSLGVTLAYGIGSGSSTPTDFYLLDRINSIGGISISPEQIDASALEDKVTRNIKGRADTGGTLTITVNFTDETAAQWKKLMADYKAKATTDKMWFQVIAEDLGDAFFTIAQPPEELPQPELSQNALLTVEIPLTIEEYKGMSAKITPQVNPA